MASSEPLQELITCSICLEVFNNPMSLKCRHIYCHDCIQQLRQGLHVHCPDCRKTCSIHDIEKDFRTQTLVDEYSLKSNRQKGVSCASGSKRVCDICKEPGKVVICKACDEYLCSDCDTTHRDSELTRSNKLAHFIETFKEKDLQQIDTELPQLDPCITGPVGVLKGEEWQPQTSTQIKVGHQVTEQMRELIPHTKVGDKWLI